MRITSHDNVFMPVTGRTPDLAGINMPFTLSGGGDIHAPAKSEDPSVAKEQLVEAGRQFEAYFISHLLKVMRETVPKGAVNNKHGAYFESFYDQEIGLRAAESGGLGITRMVAAYAHQQDAFPPVSPQVPPVAHR